MKIRKISIIIPAYNEEKTIAKTVKSVLKANIHGIRKEIIIVNDGSSDSTLQNIRRAFKNSEAIKLINKRKNEGKGAAIQDALKMASGDVMIIQDADLEYNPTEIPKLLEPIMGGAADVVYGSRFMGGHPHRVHLFWHMLGNSFLTLVSNMLTNVNLSDMETCYKLFTREVANKLELKEKRFGFEPEFTVKVAKMKARIYETGIGYRGRSYSEGKKINWKDGFRALYCLLKYSTTVPVQNL